MEDELSYIIAFSKLKNPQELLLSLHKKAKEISDRTGDNDRYMTIPNLDKVEASPSILRMPLLTQPWHQEPRSLT